MKRIRRSTVVFSAIIVAGIICAILASFGPVRLLGLGGAVVGVIALTTDRRKHRNRLGASR